MKTNQATAIITTKFPLGCVCITPGAIEKISAAEQVASLRRHAMCDWGDVCGEDRAENERALREGFRLVSVYSTLAGTTFWIITEADRSVTTFLLPDEY